jgi:hypothetical protein
MLPCGYLPPRLTTEKRSSSPIMERLTDVCDRFGTEKKETNHWFVARPTLSSSTEQNLFLIERYRKNAEGCHICGIECPQKEVLEWTMRIHSPEFQECAKANAELATDHRDAGNDLNPVARGSQRRSYPVRGTINALQDGKRSPKMGHGVNLQSASKDEFSNSAQNSACWSLCRQSNQSSGDNKMMLMKLRHSLLAAGAAVVLVTAAYAQVQTATSVQHGVATSQVTIERGEVVFVSGNDVMIKMEDGSLRHFPDVPESARIEVDGKMLGVHDMKPGMKVQRTTITTTTPKTVTTVQTVTGKVWFIQAPNSVILTLANGTNQQFRIPKDQKFNVDGQMVDAFALKKGMNVTATKIVEVPTVQVTHTKTVTGEAAPKIAVQPTPPADVPILIAESTPAPVTTPQPAPAEAPPPTPAPATAETPAPATAETPAPVAASPASMTWKIVLLVLLVLAAIGWIVLRKRRSRT